MATRTLTALRQAKDGIAGDFLARGVSNEQIVLAFYPPELREMGDFAVT